MSRVKNSSDFLRRLAALVAAPYTNLVRYHGVFAGRSRWRKRLPAPPRKTSEPIQRSNTTFRAIVPSRLLRRITYMPAAAVPPPSRRPSQAPR